MSLPTDRRWPRWVYAEGDEPDYRFTFANERTFLAWIRTGLALIAAGTALEAFPLDLPSTAGLLLSALLILFGSLCAVAAWSRWARAERAMRLRRPLPSSSLVTALSVVIVAAGVVLVAIHG